MTTANDLNKQTIDLINYRGGFAWRNNTGRRGSGDVIGMYHGYFVSVETKTENDIPTYAQLDFVLDVREHGGFCFARGIDDVVEFLDLIDKYEAERNGSPVIPF